MAMTIMMLEEEEQVERTEVKAKREGKEEEERGEDGPSFTCLTFALPGSQYPQGPRCSLRLLSFYRYRNKPREMKSCAQDQTWTGCQG